MAEPTTILQAHEKYALPLAFADNGGTLYSGGFNGTVSAWDAAEWTEVVTIQAHEQSVNCGTITTTDRLATGSTDTSLRIWTSDLADRERTLTDHKKTVAGIASHPSKPLIASASYDTTARVWDLERDAPPMVLEGHSRNVTSVEFADESALVTGGIGDEIVVWSLDSGEELSRLGGHGQAVSGIAAQGESQVWSVGYNGTVRCWSTVDWTAVTAVDLPGEQHPTGIAVNQQTGNVAITRDGGVIVLDSDGEPREEHTTTIKGISTPLWSKDGETLCVGGADGAIRIYQ